MMCIFVVAGERISWHADQMIDYNVALTDGFNWWML